MIRLLLVLSLSFFNQPLQNNFIDWEATRKLNWNDFQATPPAHRENAALTSSNIKFSFGYGSRGFTYSISCRFDKSRSWVRVKNDYILAHEQGHFDIAEIHARKLKKSLGEYRYNEASVQTDINRIYDGLMRQHNDLQAQYDLETDHSRDSAKQVAWLGKIAGDLKKWEGFAGYRSSK